MASPPITSYVQLPFTTSPDDLADAAVAYLQSVWTGWTPADGDPSIVMIEGLAPMAANAAQIAANMPPAALIALGELLGIAYEPGVSASATATFTVSGANGAYDIPAGSEIDLGGVAFQTTLDLSITISNSVSNTGSVTIAANDVGVFANGLDATGWTPVTLPVYVTDLSLGAATSGGVDQQDDTDYLNSVAQELQLRATSLITLLDFEIVAVNTAGVGRALAVADGSHPRTITVYVTDPEGNPCSSTIKDALTATFTDDSVRMVNADISVADANYTTVGVVYTLLALPGVDQTGLEATCDSTLTLELSPAGWGNPSGVSPGLTWVDQPVVHVNKMIGILSSVVGVDYVEAVAFIGSNIASLSSNLSTGGAITSIPILASQNAISNGNSIILTDPTGVHTQTWVVNGNVNVSDTHITVVSQTPNYAYPSAGTTIAGPVVGDLTMNQNAAGALPMAGTMSGTIDTP